jgi:DNA-directed RNA polymerase subunit RPC12/RpoP
MIFIHKFQCIECGAEARADRNVGCWRCGEAKMEILERQIAEIEP